MTRPVEELEELILKHKQAYYLGNATISDAEYDELEDELRTRSPDSYALKTVGYVVSQDKVPHNRPMLSLDKRRDIQEVADWMDGDACVVTDKMDGSSASLVFHDGVFSVAKTRGDGRFGENLTAHFRHIKIPKLLRNRRWRSGEVEVRGELCISSENFDKLSDEMASRNLDRPKSIRNIVAGLLHKKDDFDLCSYLTYFAYELIADDPGVTSETEKFKALEQEGFNTPTLHPCATKQDFAHAVNDYENRIGSSRFLTDGLVVAVDNIVTQLARGFTAHHPKGKLAFKFKSDTATTTIRDIVLDIGRTGRLTFVGIVDPVELSGAQVQRVTLNNVNYIREHNINTGCKIEITRSGEVIPKHEKTLETNGEYSFRSSCPICEMPLIPSDTGVDLLCTNNACAARVKGRISNWIDVTGIENIGPRTLDLFYEKKLVRSIEDLYVLKEEQINTLDGLGDKSAATIVENIRQTLNMPFSVFLNALGIDGLGPSVAKLITGRFPAPQTLREASVEALVEVDGIGEVLAGNVLDGMRSFGWSTLEILEQRGLVLSAAPDRASSIFEGRTFVITGKLSMPRNDIKKYIEDNGGKVTGSISKNTSYLVCNEPSDTGKYKKATQLGVTIITEQEIEGLHQPS